jgi:hypothetical protein
MSNFNMINIEECPVCFECIENTNFTITECSHKFHSKCLIETMAHGSFNCPLCRFVLGTQIKHEEEDEDEDYSTTLSDFSDEESELYTDYTLRGLRFFTNNLFNRMHSITDLEDEKKCHKFDNCNYAYAYTATLSDVYTDFALRGLRLFTNNLEKKDHELIDIKEEINDDIPDTYTITEKLLKQNISYNDLVNCILYRCFDNYIVNNDRSTYKSTKVVIRNINILIAQHKKL